MAYAQWVIGSCKREKEHGCCVLVVRMCMHVGTTAEMREVTDRERADFNCPRKLVVCDAGYSMHSVTSQFLKVSKTLLTIVIVLVIVADRYNVRVVA